MFSIKKSPSVGVMFQHPPLRSSNLWFFSSSSGSSACLAEREPKCQWFSEDFRRTSHHYPESQIVRYSRYIVIVRYLRHTSDRITGVIASLWVLHQISAGPQKQKNSSEKKLRNQHRFLVQNRLISRVTRRSPLPVPTWAAFVEL